MRNPGKTNRYLQKYIEEDLKAKMVLLSGPRQVGKTTLARQIVPENAYFNWDIADQREKILRREWPIGENLWAFDEIHKYAKWRNYLKGLYDQFHGQTEFLVTGSARLDYYRRGGDSLQGRYFFYRMHPFSFAEAGFLSKKDLHHMLQTGGFPEPMLNGTERFHRRWSRDYRTRLIREDLVSLENVKDIGSLELLSMLLSSRVGSPLSASSFSNDVHVSPKTVQNWIQILERLYSIFLISSFRENSLRSVRKEKKHYFWDWAQVSELPARAENFVASHLLKYVHLLQDSQGIDMELKYFRDTDGREVDFIVTEKNIPVMAIEVKWQSTDVHKPLTYFKKKFPGTEVMQVHFEGDREYQTTEGVLVLPVEKLLNRLV